MKPERQVDDHVRNLLQQLRFGTEKLAQMLERHLQQIWRTLTKSRICCFCDKLSGFWSLCLKSLEIKTRFSRKNFDKNIFSEKQKIGISSNLVSNIENIWEFSSLSKIEAESFFLFPGINWLHHEQIWRILLRTWLFCHRLLF